MTSAPPARLVDALTGKKAPTAFFKALSEADEYVASLDANTRDSDDAAATIGELLHENACLRARLDELEDGGLQQQVAELGRALLAAQADRDRALLEAHVWRGRAQCGVKS